MQRSPQVRQNVAKANMEIGGNFSVKTGIYAYERALAQGFVRCSALNLTESTCASLQIANSGYIENKRC